MISPVDLNFFGLYSHIETSRLEQIETHGNGP